MSTTRREFIQMSAVAGAALALGRGVPALGAPGGGGEKTLLILGGTGFLGPACTEVAMARGFKVTLFNRGRREDARKRTGRPSLVPDGVEVLYGNRDPEKTADADNDESRGEKKDPDSPKGLSQLLGREWDAVIDTSGYWPRMVKASAELLAPHVKQYVFVSSLSAYAKNDKPNADESAETATLQDPKTEDFGSQFENYGGGKAMCEQAAEAAMPGRVAVMRAGFIVGPRDSSKRFLYWPVRASMGGDMIVPGAPTDPIQIIDVRDLAAFMIHCIEQRIMGPFTVTGPAKPMTMQGMVEGCIKGVGGASTPTWVPVQFLEENKVEAQFPLWIPPEGENAGMHLWSIAKALKAGLTCRPIEDTAKASLEWYQSLTPELQKAVVPPMLTPEREAEVVALWKKSRAERHEEGH